MKSREISFVKSFRFKIILYSLLSLIFTILTESILVFFLKQVITFSKFMQEGALHENADAGGLLGGTESGADSLANSNSLSGFADSGAESLMPGKGKNAWGLGLRGPKFGIFVAVLILIGIALFIFYFLMLSKRISHCIAMIAAGIDDIAAGDLNARIYIDGEDEFALIGRRLNSMAKDISLLMENERKNEKIKNDLITNVAHDLRTPLTSIIGYLDLIVKNPGLEEETRERYMEIAHEKSLRLQKLIEDLFSFTKVSQGEVKPNLTPLDLVKFMEQMVDEFYPSFQEMGLEYEFVSDCSSAMVMADGDLLARAFSNLIGNAVKYGKDGKSIRICINSNEEYVSTKIINYGRVIPKKDLEYIFDRFYRVEGSRSEKTGGTGLGLAIAKKVILMHEGTIRADSGMEGTTFEVILKLTT